MRCLYCGYSEGGHNVACPESVSGDAKAKAHKAWQEGYRLGRGGRGERPAVDMSAAYNLGYGQGVVALEEAENGFDPRFEDPVDLSEKELWEEHDDRIDEYMDRNFGD